MNRRLHSLLVCPIDRTPLELMIWSQEKRQLSAADQAIIQRRRLDPAAVSENITSGILLNRRRRILYPIIRGVPRMLTFPTGLTRAFQREHAERLRAAVPGFTLPGLEPRPGERDVLRTFSSEWLHYDWDGVTYWDSTVDEMHEAMSFMLDLDHHPVQDQLVLEAGIGIGGIADAVVRRHECELVGIDLSYSIDPAAKHFGGNPFLHLVQASVFALPFPDRLFDLVFSHGVIHHTYSTRDAFEGIARLPRPGGRLYVWVYNPEQERRTLGRRLVMGLERAVRPICWRLPEKAQLVVLLPLILAYLVHQNGLHLRRRATVGYGWREAEHAARDRFTPRFVHRHSEAEVEDWFRQAGYGELRRASRRDGAPACVPQNFLAQTGIDGVRSTAQSTIPVNDRSALAVVS